MPREHDRYLTHPKPTWRNACQPFADARVLGVRVAVGELRRAENLFQQRESALAETEKHLLAVEMRLATAVGEREDIKTMLEKVREEVVHARQALASARSECAEIRAQLSELSDTQAAAAMADARLTESVQKRAREDAAACALQRAYCAYIVRRCRAEVRRLNAVLMMQREVRRHLAARDAATTKLQRAMKPQAADVPVVDVTDAAADQSTKAAKQSPRVVKNKTGVSSVKRPLRDKEDSFSILNLNLSTLNSMGAMDIKKMSGRCDKDSIYEGVKGAKPSGWSLIDCDPNGFGYKHTNKMLPKSPRVQESKQ